MKPISTSAAKRIAEAYGYDQVIIIARRVGEAPAPHGEHCTTYGVDRAHCSVAAAIGDFLKFKVMGWVRAQAASPTVPPSNPPNMGSGGRIGPVTKDGP
jgi:hypothetical protein